MESLDTGKRLVESEYDVADVVSVFRHFGRVAAEDAGRVVDTGNPDVVSRIVHEPVGVCGLITPWNYPLLQVSWKVAPCLAAGNTFVLKPSELTPHSAIHLMRLLEEAGLPAGVANLVLGTGAEAGAPLSTDPRVDLVSFTGGLETGKRIMAAASDTVKKIALELGRQEPQRRLRRRRPRGRARLRAHRRLPALRPGVLGRRPAGGRGVGPRPVRRRARRARRADPDRRTVRREGRDRPADQRRPPRQGRERTSRPGSPRAPYSARGGRRPDDPALADGFYYLPTVLDRCTSTMSVTQDESFGPVLTVETFRTEDEAVAIANDSIYGLAGAVWTQDAGKAQRVAGRLRMGTVWINDYHPYVPQAEWGGYKQSGIGRELGAAGLDEYRETKHVWHNIRPAEQRWFRG